MNTWIERQTERERERCELCGTEYAYTYDRPLEAAADARRLCETVWGNIGAHIAFQYLLFLVLFGQLHGLRATWDDACLLQAVYHGAFATWMVWFARARLIAPVTVYLEHFLTLERVGYMMLYELMWLYVLFGRQSHWSWIASNVAIQTFPPLIPYFHMKTLEEMNAGRRRVLGDWGGRN